MECRDDAGPPDAVLLPLLSRLSGSAPRLTSNRPFQIVPTP